MKKIFTVIMMLFASTVSLTSCDTDTSDGGDDNLYTLSGTKYIGELSILGKVQEDIVFYADENNNTLDILMPEVSFMPGLMPNLDMALVSIGKESSDPDTYHSDEIQMVGIYDRLPLINDVIQSITNINVEKSGHDICVTFDCAISTTAMGDMTVPVQYNGVEEGFVSDKKTEFTLDHPEGFYITTSKGSVQLPDVKVVYDKESKSLSIDGFSFSPVLPGTLLPIVGVTESDDKGKTTLTGDDIDVSYTFMTQPATGIIYDLKAEIIDDMSQLEFTISAAMGGSGVASDYPCTYNGAIDIK